ncbi:MAG TPA: CBS domain-containing protein [Candidatus Sulfotelmatobacter sp.]|nr:CBS domain-containing protein [Candidatus Sulfotelmatobacter sp.]
MSEKDITKFLTQLGFSKREVQIYIFLAKSGVQSTSFVAKRLKMERVQAYRTFKKLQEKGFIEATLERPTRFTVVPFEKLFENFLEARKGELASFNEQKEELLSAWHAVSAPESEYAVAKFSIITGKKKIHLKMLNMIEEAKQGVLVLTSGSALIQQDLAGVFDAIENPSQRRGVQMKILTEISPENLKIIERIDKNMSSGKADIECHHMHMESKLFPSFLIKDNEEALLYSTSGDTTPSLTLEEEGLWINDRMFISILQGFFEQMWQIAMDAPERIEEIKTGVPARETTVIKDPKEAWEKVVKVLDSAKESIVAITSSQGINNIAENDIFAKYCTQDMECRLMAPLDLDNLDAAKQLSRNYEVKHVPINFLTQMIVDNKNLFMFKSPPMNDWTSDSVFYMGDTFYTNDPRSIERVAEMLNDAWKRGMDISQITSQPGMKLPTVEVSSNDSVTNLVDMILRNNTSSVLITENGCSLGVISDREVLKEIVEKRKDPSVMKVNDLQYTPIIVLDKTDPVTKALKIMQQKKAARIAIVKDGQLVGMLTEKSVTNKRDLAVNVQVSRKKQLA